MCPVWPTLDPLDRAWAAQGTRQFATPWGVAGQGAPFLRTLLGAFEDLSVNRDVVDRNVEAGQYRVEAELQTVEQRQGGW